MTRSRTTWSRFALGSAFAGVLLGAPLAGAVDAAVVELGFLPSAVTGRRALDAELAWAQGLTPERLRQYDTYLAAVAPALKQLGREPCEDLPATAPRASAGAEGDRLKAAQAQDEAARETAGLSLADAQHLTRLFDAYRAWMASKKRLAATSDQLREQVHETPQDNHALQQRRPTTSRRSLLRDQLAEQTAAWSQLKPEVRTLIERHETTQPKP